MSGNITTRGMILRDFTEAANVGSKCHKQLSNWRNDETTNLLGVTFALSRSDVGTVRRAKGRSLHCDLAVDPCEGKKEFLA